MNYKMIACDLDGTMFDSDLKIPERNLKSIRKAIAHGLVFVISSGRPYVSVAPIAEALCLNIKNQYAICFNGASAVEADTGRVIYSLPLEKEYGLHIIEKASENDVTAIAYIGGEAFSRCRADEVSQYEKRIRIGVKIDSERINKADSGFDKVLVRGEPDKLKKIEEALSVWADGKAASVYSDVKMLEYINANVSKGRALLSLADKLGIDRGDVIAIGDYFNDISMLEAAGLGIAIKCAPAPVAAAAGYVTELSAGEGAVSEVIEKFVFGE